MRGAVKLLGVIVLGGACVAVRADDGPAAQVVGVNRNVVRRLDEARRKAENKEFNDALDDYQTLLNTAGSDFVPLSGNHLVPLRWACQRGIAALPPAGLRAYRQRVDGQARKLLDQAGEPGDERLLRRIVEDFFCSTPAESALHRLGDRAFERGQFDEAARWWGQLLPAEDAETRLGYPAPEGDPALVRAKVLLARWFGGERDTWKAELDAFRKKHPTAEGRLGGRSGKLADLLIELTGQGQEPVEAVEEWSTFAGSPRRALVLPDEPTRPARLARLAREGRHGQFPLGPVAEKSPGKVLSPAEAARSLAFHPVLLDRQAVVCDARSVVAFDLPSGAREVWYDARKFLGNFDARSELPAPADLRYTLSVADDCVLARLGVQALRGDRPARDAASGLVCLERRPRKDRVRWQVKPGEGAVFEGTAVIHGRAAYIAVSRLASGQVSTAIHCYPLDAEGAPAPRWQSELFKGRDPQPKDGRLRHHLLTLAGPNVVCCTHSGAIIALDRETGRRAWAWVYAGDVEPSPWRGLACCAAVDGRVFVAPADLNRLLCLDAATGRLLWQRDGVEVVQLLGVGSSRLIFTTRTPRAGLRAVDATDGTDERGWFQPGDGGALPTFGLGFLGGSRVYWPTAEGVVVLEQASGEVPGDPTRLHAIPRGNLVFGDGCLAVADRTTLHVFTPPAWELSDRQKEAAKDARAGMARYRLAVAQRDSGQYGEAEQNFHQAAELARPGDWAAGRRLSDQAPIARHETLVEAAAKHQRERRWDEAAALLCLAAGKDFSFAQRLRAQQRLADLWELAGQPERAVAACQEVLESESLRAVAGPWASQRLDDLLGRHGQDIYAAVEKRATAAPLDSSRLEHLRRLAQAFPQADVTLRHLPELAEAEEKAGEPGRAAVAYRLWLRQQQRRGVTSGQERTRVEAALLRLCESVNPRRPSGVPPLELPLRRVDRPEMEVLRSLDDAAPREWLGQHADLALLGRADGVTALMLHGGHVLWRRSGTGLGGFTTAAGRLFCLSGAQRLLALDAETGAELWTLDAPAAFRPRPLPGGRFTKIIRATEAFLFVRLGDGTIWKLGALSGRRLSVEPPSPPDQVRYCDPVSGKVRWTHTIEARTTLSGRPARLVVQNGQVLRLVSRNYGEALQRLDAATGQPIWKREVLFTDGGPLDPAAFSVDGEACYFVHSRTLSCRALADGKLLWTLSLPGRAQHWRTCRAGDYVLAWPSDVTSARFLFRSPLGSLEWRIVLALEDRPGEGFPVLCVDVRTGKLVQRLNLPARPGPVAFQVRGWWQSAPLPAVARPELTVHAEGLTIFLGEQGWGFESSRP